MVKPSDRLIRPNWGVPPNVPANSLPSFPPNIGALVTTRLGGASTEPWNSLNLGINTADSREMIEKNRKILTSLLPRGLQIQWLRQVHGSKGISIESIVLQEPPEADFCFTRTKEIACAVLTADCLPILISNSAGTEIAAVHAGWRGLASDVLGEAISSFHSRPKELVAWIGPCISQDAFEVGTDVLDAMENADHLKGFDLDSIAKAHPENSAKYYLDLVAIARYNLLRLGVKSVFGGELCSYFDSERFFSYRRDGETGRMASLIWIQPS